MQCQQRCLWEVRSAEVTDRDCRLETSPGIAYVTVGVLPSIFDPFQTLGAASRCYSELRLDVICRFQLGRRLRSQLHTS